MSYTTSKSILIDERDFFVGSNSYDSTTTPSNEIKITASDGAAEDRFGYSLAVGSDRIVVGSLYDDDNGSNSGSAYIFDLNGNELAKITASDGAANDFFANQTGIAIGSGRIVVGATGDDDNGADSGSAYIFDLDGNELSKITASDCAAGDVFGAPVSIGSGRIVVGSRWDDDNGTNSGSAYIFDLDGNELTKITASDGTEFDVFGWSLAVDCGRIVVGAPLDDDNGTDSGSAYIFDLYGNELAKITASDGVAEDQFGYSVAVGSGRIVVGAPLSDDNGLLSGSAYIFDLDGNQLAKITASDAAADDQFGSAVSVGSGRIVVSAFWDGDNGIKSGSAYVFDLDGNQLDKITASDGAAEDRFGYSVAVGSGKIIIGAIFDADNGTNSGSAYIYTTPNQKHFLDQLD